MPLRVITAVVGAAILAGAEWGAMFDVSTTGSVTVAFLLLTPMTAFAAAFINTWYAPGPRLSLGDMVVPWAAMAVTLLAVPLANHGWGLNWLWMIVVWLALFTVTGRIAGRFARRAYPRHSAHAPRQTTAP